jgi:hypothetical protein
LIDRRPDADRQRDDESDYADHEDRGECATNQEERLPAGLLQRLLGRFFNDRLLILKVR